MIGFGVVVLLAAAAATPAKSTAKSTPAPIAAAKPAGSGPIEATISDAAIEALLKAAAPFDETMEQEVGALGITKTVQVKVHLENPRVKISGDGVHVTMDYRLRDADGMVDTSGTATPILALAPLPGKPLLEGKLTHSGITLMGVEVPLEDLVEPIQIPSSISEEVDLGEKTATTEFRATEVIPEDGHVRVKGVMTVTPKAAKK